MSSKFSPLYYQKIDIWLNKADGNNSCFIIQRSQKTSNHSRAPQRLIHWVPVELSFTAVYFYCPFHSKEHEQRICFIHLSYFFSLWAHSRAQVYSQQPHVQPLPPGRQRLGSKIAKHASKNWRSTLEPIIPLEMIYLTL